MKKEKAEIRIEEAEVQHSRRWLLCCVVTGAAAITVGGKRGRWFIGFWTRKAKRHDVSTFSVLVSLPFLSG
jgi:hypothetical protein